MVYSTLLQLFYCSARFRQKIRLTKNIHFINFENGLGQWQLQLPLKFVVGQKDKISFNRNFLEQIVATDFFLFRN